MMKQPDGLISILVNANARDDERDDAAMALGGYDGQDVQEALYAVARDPAVAEIIRGACGESLAEIWIRQNTFPTTQFLELDDIAKREAEGLLLAKRPEWLNSAHERTS